MSTYAITDSKSNQDNKKISMNNNRVLYYRKFTRDEEKDGTKESIINNSIGYVILKDLKKQKTTGDKPEKLQNVVKNELHFFDEKYVIYKNAINEVTEPEWKTDYLKSDEDDIYKLNDSRIKGYFVVQNEGSEQPCLTTVLLVSKRKFFLLLLIFFLLFLSSMCAYAFFNPGKTEIPVAESPVIEFAEDATEYDDEPVVMEQPQEDVSNSSIKFNLFDDVTLTAGDKIPFANYSTNIDNIEFLVTYAGETEPIYSTGVIKPGTKVDWNIYDTLSSGNYTFDIYMAVYPEDGSEPSYSRAQINFNVVLI